MRCLRSQRGSVAPFVALLVPILLGLSGLAVDVGNLYLAHSRLQAACDAGALAGSLELPYDPNISNGKVVQAAKEMVKTNYSTATINSVGQGSEFRSVCVSASITVDTILMGALGIYQESVSADACAGFNNLEIVFVIDSSGSMKGTPMYNTVKAANNLVDLVMPTGGAGSVKVGLVPFRGKVRLPAGVDGLPKGCRNADGSLNDGDYNTCFKGVPEAKGLSTDKYSIKNAINNMKNTMSYGSGTVISEGIKWGREMLTPTYPFTEGGDMEKMRKVMIVLTDGDTEDGKCGGKYATNQNPNPYMTNAYYDMGVEDCHCEDSGCLNNAMLAEADKAKDLGIEIFSVRYGDSDWTDKQLMKQIASSAPNTEDHYYSAPSSYDIDDMFKQIGKQLGWRLIN